MWKRLTKNWPNCLQSLQSEKTVSLTPHPQTKVTTNIAWVDDYYLVITWCSQLCINTATCEARVTEGLYCRSSTASAGTSGIRKNAMKFILDWKRECANLCASLPANTDFVGMRTCKIKPDATIIVAPNIYFQHLWARFFEGFLYERHYVQFLWSISQIRWG